jgi:small conductance mechanosensitive channel
MELHFRLDYGDDVERARGLVLEAARGDPRILADPEPWAQVTSLDESAVRLTLRAWTTIEVHWDARFELIQRVKQAFDAAGFAVAYPHQVALQKEPHVR